MASNQSALIIPPAPGASTVVTNDIRDIKPPVEVPAPLAWLLWPAGIFLALAILASAGWLWLKRRSRLRQPAPVPPHLRARRRLEAALHSINDPRPFCIAVSDAVRLYLEERFRLRAPERTTEEFLHDLQQTAVLNAEQKQTLAAFLERCDLVKFARFEPNEAALRELLDSSHRLIHETEHTPVEREDVDPAERMRETRHRRGEAMAIGGYALQAFPLFILVAYAVAFARWVELLWNVQRDFATDTARELFGAWWELTVLAFGGALGVFAAAALLGLSGLVLLTVALGSGFRARWLFWFLLCYSVVLLAVFPLGTAFALFFIVFCLRRRSEFLASDAPATISRA